MLTTQVDEELAAVVKRSRELGPVVAQGYGPGAEVDVQVRQGAELASSRSKATLMKRSISCSLLNPPVIRGRWAGGPPRFVVHLHALQLSR